MESTSSVPSAFYSAPTRKRFQNESDPPLVPIIGLDREGTIQSLTVAARRALAYADEAPIDPCFFAHVHASNQHRVMQDLADMVVRGKQQERWLLRLRTGNGRWRWYRAFVRSELGGEADRIRVHLRPL